MVSLVQKPRGMNAYNKSYRHLPWPSDVTQQQKELWYRCYLLSQGFKSVKFKKYPPPPPPAPKSLESRLITVNFPGGKLFCLLITVIPILIIFSALIGGANS